MKGVWVQTAKIIDLHKQEWVSRTNPRGAGGESAGWEENRTETTRGWHKENKEQNFLPALATTTLKLTEYVL